MRILVESGLLPDGSLQLVCGERARRCSTTCDSATSSAFTGSASTAERLRAHDRVQTGGVRFTSETDSINAVDARPGCRAPAPRSSTRT